MKVVFDTNVFVSAFIVPGSKGEDALLLAQRRKAGLYCSVPILTETARILRAQFDQSEECHSCAQNDWSRGDYCASVAYSERA